MLDQKLKREPSTGQKIIRGQLIGLLKAIEKEVY